MGVLCWLNPGHIYYCWLFLTSWKNITKHWRKFTSYLSQFPSQTMVPINFLLHSKQNNHHSAIKCKRNLHFTLALLPSGGWPPPQDQNFDQITKLSSVTSTLGPDGSHTQAKLKLVDIHANLQSHHISLVSEPPKSLYTKTSTSIYNSSIYTQRISFSAK